MDIASTATQIKEYHYKEDDQLIYYFNILIHYVC